VETFLFRGNKSLIMMNNNSQFTTIGILNSALLYQICHTKLSLMHSSHQTTWQPQSHASVNINL